VKTIEYIGPFDAVEVPIPDTDLAIVVARGVPVVVDDDVADGTDQVVAAGDEAGDEYVIVSARGGLLAQTDNWREVPAAKAKPGAKQPVADTPED